MNTKESPIIDSIDSDESWDNRELGADGAFAKAVELDSAQQSSIDDALGLQMISIRLPKSLIEDFKFLGHIHGLKYQTLMRQSLVRFAEAETKRLKNEAIAAQLKALHEDCEEHIIMVGVDEQQRRQKFA